MRRLALSTEPFCIVLPGRRRFRDPPTSPAQANTALDASSVPLLLTIMTGLPPLSDQIGQFLYQRAMEPWSHHPDPGNRLAHTLDGGPPPDIIEV